MKKSKILKICHLVFLGIVTLFCLNSAFMSIFNIGLTNSIYADFPRSSMVLFGIINVTNIVALLLSIFYIIKDYGKNVAWIYKAFILTMAIANVVGIITNFVTNNEGRQFHSLVLILILMVVQILIFLVMVFGKDLGNKFTWFLFFVILAIDIVRLIITGLNTAFDLFWVVSFVTRLALCGTMAIDIYGKYKDKQLRGTT